MHIKLCSPVIKGSFFVPDPNHTVNKPLKLHMKSLKLPHRLARFWAPACLVISTSLSLAQTTDSPPASEPDSRPDEVVTLSPFEVVAENKGYFASNTMSGTRLNSKIEDLGQSITVMTKEQMADFAMLDINDVFDHMASTEGTGLLLRLFDTDRTGAVVDNVSLNPNNANRVRGIGGGQHRLQQHRDHGPRAH